MWSKIRKGDLIVMKEIHYFVSEDGQKFDTEEECETYEFAQTMIPKLGNCRAFDESFEPIVLDHNIISDRRICEGIYYLYVGDKAAFDTISKIFKGFGFYSPSDSMTFECPTYLQYSDIDDAWIDLKLSISQIQSVIEVLEGKITPELLNKSVCDN